VQTFRPAPEIIVVGLGAVGSALTHHLARRGAQVLGLDRFHPPHDQGSSHGRTRITRLAVGEGAAYVPLVLRSHQLWRELEAAGHAPDGPLFRRTGGLVIGSAAADAGAFHGQAGFFARTAALARQFGIAHELLDARTVRGRHPQFLLRDDESAYFEPEAGVLAPERCVAAQLAAAAASGAQLSYGERVLSLRAGASGVTVHTDQGTRHAAQVVLTAGAWIPGLAGPPFASRLAVQRQVLHWFRSSTPALWSDARCPTFIWLHGPTLEDAMYGFPMGDGVDGVKIATEQVRLGTDPDAVERRVAPAEAQALLDRHVRGRLTGVEPLPVAAATCLYTSSVDGRFVIDRHPEMPALTVVSACSGHGFKHSAGLGEALAQQLLGETPHASLAAFGLGDQ
jgi:sarcosine oxidase